MFPIHLPIPIATPISVGDPKLGGRTQPLQMHCEICDEPADYIVKLWANPQVFLAKHSLAREVYGSLLARCIGLDTPDIAFIEIDSDFYISQPNHRADILHESIGYNFGSKFIPGATIFSPPVQSSMHSNAVKVFCFDMLICNPDRRKEKPNVFQMPNGFMVFDHEQAFPFSRPRMILGGFPDSWQYIKEPWHRDHVFYSDIRNHDCSVEIEEFVTDVGYLSNDLLGTIEEQIPEDWNTGDDIQNITNYLANTRDNVDRFKRSLQEILA